MIRPFRATLRISRVFELSPAEVVVLPQLAMMAICFRLAIWFTSLPSIAGFAKRSSAGLIGSRLPLLGRRVQEARVFRIADIAARVIKPEGQCLIRSLLVFWLLKTRGKDTQLVIGVQRNEAQINAHAWIETTGGPIGDRPESIAQFTELFRI